MELQGKKIEFDLEEFVPLLLSNKQEGFRLIGERFLNAVMEKEFETFIGAGKHERSEESSNKIEGTTNSHTYITALNKATLRSTQDTTLKGAVVDAKDLELSAGRNLVMQSVQDTQTIRGKSKGGSVSVNVLTAAPEGASTNYGTTKGDKAWVNEVTSLNAQNSIRVSVGDTTTLKGASITNKDASGVDQGNLQLTTRKLIAEDIQDHDNYKNSNVGLGVGSVDFNPSLNSIEFAKSTQDKEQIVRATIGKGSITTNSDTSHINRDIVKTKQLTKDESSDIELYASDSSINALTHPVQTYKDMKQKAKDVGLASHKEIAEDLPSARKSKRVDKSKQGGKTELKKEVNDFMVPSKKVWVNLH